MKLGLYRPQSASSGMEQSHVFLPDGPAYLGAYLEKYLGFTNIETDYNPKRLLEKKPDIIGLSAVTESINHIFNLASDLKKVHDVPIIIGGPHITYLPKTLPKSIDIGVMGEGEETMLELMKLALNKELVPEKLREVKGIVFHDTDGSVHVTQPRALIADIDTVPMPWRHINNEYHPAYQNIFTSRGCPYKCTYCIETRFWTKTRFHSAERVVAEIEEILRHFPEQTSISMGDTIFAMNKKRMKKISELIVEAGIHKKVYFGCNARANIFDEEVCEILKAMNVKQINFGFESGSDRILDFLKGSVKAKQNEKALELSEKHGFIPLGHIIIGAPIETVEDSAQSYWFLRRNDDRIWRASVHPMTPFPGSYMWSYAAERNLVDESFMDWESFNLSNVPGVYLNEHYGHEEYIRMGVMFDEYQIKKQSPDNYLIHYTNKDLYYDLIYKQLSYTLKTDKDIKVLEIGNNPNRLKTFVTENISVDRIEVDNGYLDVTGLEKDSFDSIVMVHTLERLREPEKCVSELKEFLKPEGKIINVFFNVKNKEFIRMFFEDGGIVPFIWGPTNIRNIQMMTLQSTRKMFEKSGYKNFQVIQSNMNPSPDSKYTEVIQSIIPVDAKEMDVTSYIVNVEL